MAGGRLAERTSTARVRESVVVSEPADHLAARTRRSATIRKMLRNGGQGPSKPLPSTVTLRGHAQTWAHSARPWAARSAAANSVWTWSPSPRSCRRTYRAVPEVPCRRSSWWRWASRARWWFAERARYHPGYSSKNAQSLNRSRPSLRVLELGCRLQRVFGRAGQDDPALVFLEP